MIKLLKSYLRNFTSAADCQPNILKEWFLRLFFFLFRLLLSFYFLLNLRNRSGIAKERGLILGKVKFSSQNMNCDGKRCLAEDYVKNSELEVAADIFLLIKSRRGKIGRIGKRSGRFIVVRRYYFRNNSLCSCACREYSCTKNRKNSFFKVHLKSAVADVFSELTSVKVDLFSCTISFVMCFF